jgi:hypothetical protein
MINIFREYVGEITMHCFVTMGGDEINRKPYLVALSRV